MTAQYKLLNNIIGWMVFAFAAFVFISTIEPTASFWDCGEYIACSYKLEVGHPPGAPTFLLLGRFFSLFAKDKAHVAACVNTMSALASAGTILFMFWSLTLLGRKLLVAMKQQLTDVRMWAIFGSAAIGSIAYAFTDSFWFSAVEGEVYAMSSFFTALVFWSILRWDADDSSRSDRWLVFIAYMIGLSVGVHLLNLLTIPSIVLIIYFKKYKPTFLGVVIALFSGVALLAVVQNGIIPGVVSDAANYELFFVNKLGLPYNGGTIIYFASLIAMIVTGLLYTTRGGQNRFRNFVIAAGTFFFFTLVAASAYGSFLFPFITASGAAFLILYFRENRALLNTIILSFTVLLIGYSTFFVLVIRSKANTPMDENNPENAISLLSYLNREQYGDWPLLYGPYYDAIQDYDHPYSDASPVYARDEAHSDYGVTDNRKQSIPNFAPEMCTVFPRMWDYNQRSHWKEYEFWGNVNENQEDVEVNAGGGRTGVLQVPTFTANLEYMWRYQLGWMYGRYFMWNFAGRQNDIQGHRKGLNGYWQSGIPFVDSVDMSKAPDRLKHNFANNKFYLLPLILGLIGLWFHYSRDWRNAIVITMLFLLTGIAIVIYLNQYPLQPRERDYAYAGSFFAFAFWIGIGAYAVFNFLHTLVSKGSGVSVSNAASGPEAEMSGARPDSVGYGILALTLAACSSVPIIMGVQGWDDHDRSHRYTCRDFAENYLNSCAKNAVLFTNGDNDTFPLWYAQEVEGFRTDVRVLNLSLLNTDWYIDQARRKAYDSDTVPFSLPHSRYREGSCDQVKMPDALYPDKKPVISGKLMSVREVINEVRAAKNNVLDVNSRVDDNGETYNDTMYVLPTNHFYIPVTPADKAYLKQTGAIAADTPDSLILDQVEWTVKKHYILKADLMILDLLASNDWKRPVYFAVTAGKDAYLNLDPYFRLEGLAYRLLPLKADKRDIAGQMMGCNTQLMYDNVMKGFKWGGLRDTTKRIYMDENNLRFTTNQRIQMITLAKVLNDEGKFKMAENVLDTCQTVMPRKNVPYEAAMVYMVGEYYRATAGVKALKLSNTLFAQCEDEYKFYNDVFGPPSATDDDNSSDDRDYLRNAMGMLTRFAQQYKQKEAVENYKNRLKAIGINPNDIVPPDDDMSGAGPGGRQFSQEMLDSLMKTMPQDCLKSPNGGMPALPGNKPPGATAPTGKTPANKPQGAQAPSGKKTH